MKPIDVILTKLRKAGSDPVQAGSGWQARCPGHDDKKASLSIAEASDGKVLLTCHAGCSTEAVVEKLGLTMVDLFPPRGNASPPTIYGYRDAQGHVVFEKLRHEPKRFVQRRSDGEGGYIYKLSADWYRQKGDGWQAIKNESDPAHQPEEGARWFPAAPRVLFRLPEIMEAVQAGRVIIYVEGEKDVETVVGIGLDATTNAGGAGKDWREEYGEALRGATVVFIPDRDKAGGELFDRYAPHLGEVAMELRRLDLPEGFKDITDWLRAGHTREDLEGLILAAPVWTEAGPPGEILDTAPESIRRPLSIVDGRGHLVTWAYVRAHGNDVLLRVVLRDDGRMFGPAVVPNALPMEELGVAVELPHVPHLDSAMSGGALKRYAAGERPEPAEVFDRARGVVDFFMDFSHSVGTQSDLVDLSALYIMGSYLLDAFTVVGYLWPNGDKGAGKTKLLVVITDLAYLGVLVTAGGSFASLRDLADYGACLGFDDSENIMDVRRTDPDKRTLLLAGNRRGTYVTLKEPVGRNGWRTRFVAAFCPRLFSAINLPDETLGSRAIIVPLVRSADDLKANRDPADHEAWPVDRRQLVDDLWALGLANLTALRRYDRLVPGRVPLVGRLLEPWRAVLAVALWLQEEHGIKGVFDRMTALAVRYQDERGEIEEASPVRILVIALRRMMEAAKSDVLEFTPTEVATIMNEIAIEDDIDHADDTFTNARKIGRLLKRLRMDRAQRTAGAKRWKISQRNLDALARAYGMGAGQCRVAVCADDAVSRETPSTDRHTAPVPPALMAVNDMTATDDTVSRETPSTDPHMAPELPAPVAANDLNWGTP